MRKSGDTPVPHHTLVRKLGQGNFGDVWEAEGPGGTRKALKFIPYGTNLLREYRAIKNIVNVRSAFLMQISDLWLLDDNGTVLDSAARHGLDRQTSGISTGATGTLIVGEVSPDVAPAELVVAMDLGDCSLGDLLHQFRESGQPGIPQADLLRYMEDAARGIDYLNEARHDLGEDEPLAIRHCDIKPDNIMLQGGGAKICDFGLARLADNPEHARRTRSPSAGSPPYMAPECLDAKKGATSTTDQYSLAITYFELLTGDLPFADDDKSSITAILIAKEQGRLDFSKLPERQREVLEQATSREPSQRFVTASQMVAALREAVDPSSAVDGDKVKPKQTRLLWPVLTVLAAIGALAAVFWVTSRPVETTDRQFERWVEKGQFDSAYALLSDMSADALPIRRDELIEHWRRRAWDRWPDDNGRDLDDLLEKITVDRQATTSCQDVLNSLVDQANELLGAEPAEDTPQRSKRLIEIAARALNSVESQSELGQFSSRIRLVRLRLKVREHENGEWAAESHALEALTQEAHHFSQLEKTNFLAIRLVADQGDASKSASHIAGLEKLSAAEQLMAPWEKSQAMRALKESDWWWAGVGPVKHEATISRIWGDILPQDVVDRKIAQAHVRRRNGEYSLGRALLDTARGLDKTSDKGDEIRKAELMVDLAEGGPRALDLIGEESLDYELLHGVCERILGEGSASTLINACWVESALHLRLSAGSQFTLEDWSRLHQTINHTLTENLAAGAAEEEWIRRYARFVAASTGYRRPSVENRVIRSAAESIADLFPAEGPLSSPPLDTASRQQVAADILYGALRTLAPRDANFTPRRFFRDAESRYDGRSWLHSAARLGSDSTPAIDAYRLIAAAYPADPAGEVDWAEIQKAASQLIGDPSTRERLASRGVDVMGLVWLLHAKSLAKTTPNARLATIKSYAEAYRLLMESESVADEDSPAESSDEQRILYEELLLPACELTKRLIEERTLSAIPTDQRQGLSGLLAASGNFIRENERYVRELMGGNTDPASVAYTRFEMANMLYSTSVSLVNQGLALIEIQEQPVDWRATLRALASNALDLAPTDPGPNYLLGYVTAVDARASAHTERRGMFRSAIMYFKDAADRSEPNSVEKARALVGLSTANLEQAFYDDGNRDRLIKSAETYARDARRIRAREYPEYAHIALGNSLEDRAFYLKEDEHYDEAVEEFRKAQRASRRRGRAGSYASLCAGRALLRQALAHKTTPEVRDLLAESRKEFERAARNGSNPAERAETYHWCSFVFENQKELGRAERASALSASEESVPDWPIYQLRWAKLAEQQGRTSDAERRARKVVTANRLIDPSVLYEAIVLTLKSLSLEEQFQVVGRHRNRFPDDHGTGSKYRIQLLIYPCQTALKQEDDSLWKKHEVDCKALLNAAHGMSLSLKDLDREQTSGIQSLCAYWLGGMYIKEGRWELAANNLESSIQLKARMLEKDVQSSLDDLANPRFKRTTVRRGLSNDQRGRLDEHLRETVAHRTFLGVALANVVLANDEAEAKEHMQRALRALRPLDRMHFEGSDVVGHFQAVGNLVDAYERKLERKDQVSPD